MMVAKPAGACGSVYSSFDMSCSDPTLRTDERKGAKACSCKAADMLLPAANCSSSLFAASLLCAGSTAVAMAISSCAFGETYVRQWRTLLALIDFGTETGSNQTGTWAALATWHAACKVRIHSNGNRIAASMLCVGSTAVAMAISSCAFGEMYVRQSSTLLSLTDLGTETDSNQTCTWAACATWHAAYKGKISEIAAGRYQLLSIACLVKQHNVFASDKSTLPTLQQIRKSNHRMHSQLHVWFCEDTHASTSCCDSLNCLKTQSSLKIADCLQTEIELECHECISANAASELALPFNAQQQPVAMMTKKLCDV